MKKIYSLAVILVSSVIFGQVTLTSVGAVVTENFDSMGATGTTLPTGWSAIRSSGSGTVGASLNPVVTDGSSNAGGVDNVGTTGSSDRALGSVASGSTVPSYGTQILNNTGVDITSLDITFVNEQWRTGGVATINEVVAFSYSTDATSLSDGTWTAITDGDLNEILTSTTSSATVDGNLPANQSAKSFNIAGLNIANGSGIWIKWTDSDAGGTDCMLAVDDLTVKGNSGSLSVTDIKGLSSSFVKNTMVENEVTFGADAKDVKVYNMLGQVVKSASVKSGETLEVSDLKNGAYIVTGTVNNEAISVKILKD